MRFNFTHQSQFCSETLPFLLMSLRFMTGPQHKEGAGEGQLADSRGSGHVVSHQTPRGPVQGLALPLV